MSASPFVVVRFAAAAFERGGDPLKLRHRKKKGAEEQAAEERAA